MSQSINRTNYTEDNLGTILVSIIGTYLTSGWPEFLDVLQKISAGLRKTQEA